MDSIKDSALERVATNRFAALVSIVLASLVIRSLYRAFVTPLRDIPGPFAAKFSRIWKLVEVLKGQFEKTDVALHQKYGPIVRIAPNEYSIDDPAALRVIYGHGNQFVKSPWYYASGSPDPTQADLFSQLSPKAHAESRRKVASAYSMTSLLQYEPFVDDCSATLHHRFSEFAARGEVIDVPHWMQCYAFDVITGITVGKALGFMEKGEDVGGFMASINKYLWYAANVGVYSELHPYIQNAMVLWSTRGRKGKGRQNLAYLAEFTQKQLEERILKQKKLDGDRVDFMTRLLRLHEENPDKMPLASLFGSCMTNIGAGSDTTAISLSSVVYHLLKYPYAMKKLREEIDGMAKRGEISDPVTFAEATRMPYLQAVLKEALRCHPATGLPLGRVVPKGGARLSGRYFPEGTIVGVNSWVSHANTSVFGEDAHKFRPERWLESEEKSTNMERYFMTFGMGSRTCIGKNISLMEMNKFIPQLLRDFDFELERPDKEWETCNTWFVKQKGFRAKVVRRKV